MADDQTPPTTDAPAGSDGVSDPQGAPTGHPAASEEYMTELRGESARQRRRAKTAETERDQLRARVDVHDRGEAERLAGKRLQDPRDLLDRTPLADLRADDGTIDPEKVSAAADALVAERPHLALGAAGGTGDGYRNVGQQGGGQPPKAAPSFGEVLKNRGRR